MLCGYWFCTIIVYYCSFHVYSFLWYPLLSCLEIVCPFVLTFHGWLLLRTWWMMWRTEMTRRTKKRRHLRRQRRRFGYGKIWHCGDLFLHEFLLTCFWCLILKAGPSKKRPTESATKTPVPAKKVKLDTPQKTGNISYIFSLFLYFIYLALK